MAEMPANGPFEEQAALAELERLQRELEESRRRRRQANDAFDSFLRSFGTRSSSSDRDREERLLRCQSVSRPREPNCSRSPPSQASKNRPRRWSWTTSRPRSSHGPSCRPSQPMKHRSPS